MNSKPTPETDAIAERLIPMAENITASNAQYIIKQVLTEILIKTSELERERNEAREERDIAKLEFEEISHDLSDARNRIWQLESQIEGLNNFANERFEEIQKVRKERDEAREEVDYYREKHDLTPMSWNV